MKKTLYILLMMLFVAGAASATIATSAGDIKLKKCETCGESITLCQYKGNHPKCETCGKVLENCRYKGNHPKCETCGKVLEKCRYKGKHPKCETCGKVLENCRYKGKHPKCETCGKVLENCRYKGKHPKCETCGKVLENCRYKGNHPKCKTCGKVLENCPYEGKHPVPSYDVKFTCNASDAILYVDGKKVGPANRSYSLKKGVHDVKLVADGYETQTASIQVNNSTSFNFKMKQTEFDVLISSNVKDAKITVDNETVNPSERKKMKEGNHTVKIVSEGYNDTTAVVSVDRDHTSFKFDLVPKQSTVHVTTTAGYVKNPPKSSTSSSQSTYRTQTPDHSIDWGDGFVGARYSYSSNFPIGVGVLVGGSHFNLGMEFGINIDKKMIYPSDSETVNPKFYVCISPGFVYKFFSINCGIGTMTHDYEKTSTTINSNENSGVYNGGYSSASSSVTVTDTTQEFNKMCFLLKPSIEGRIPICGGDYFITLNVGYLIIPKYKDLNGLTFGVGFQWRTD